MEGSGHVGDGGLNGVTLRAGPWKGQYYPLMGSTSYMSKPSGMSVEEEKARSFSR